jgi:hypothetical protein
MEYPEKWQYYRLPGFLTSVPEPASAKYSLNKTDTSVLSGDNTTLLPESEGQPTPDVVTLLISISVNSNSLSLLLQADNPRHRTMGKIVFMADLSSRLSILLRP